MLLSLLADLVLVVHATFIFFVVLGGLLVLWQPRIAWVHIPCAIWGAWVEFAGWICPLTPLEVDLRTRAGEIGYEGGFIERYVTAALYPQGLTREIQIGLGIAVVAVNVIIYVVAIKRARNNSPSERFQPIP
ncbi:MAG: hypothetical protein CME17_10795 [Gemmatimonadetes bacterium]|nr:hypothetical protein [Gemmatimonadota bacterium]MEC7386108.1 DUF2784 domain-containing protein [Gemmatimonadota bacterium]